MDKSKMKAIRKQVRSTDLDNAAQMNKVDGKIFERNPDTGEIRSRKSGDYGNERIEHPTTDEIIAYNRSQSKKNTTNLREDILSDLWAANKKGVDGKWYIELSQAVKIISNE